LVSEERAAVDASTDGALELRVGEFLVDRKLKAAFDWVGIELLVKHSTLLDDKTKKRSEIPTELQGFIVDHISQTLNKSWKRVVDPC